MMREIYHRFTHVQVLNYNRIFVYLFFSPPFLPCVVSSYSICSACIKMNVVGLFECWYYIIITYKTPNYLFLNKCLATYNGFKISTKFLFLLYSGLIVGTAPWKIFFLRLHFNFVKTFFCYQYRLKLLQFAFALRLSKIKNIFISLIKFSLTIH